MAKVINHEEIVVSSVAVALTPAIYNPESGVSASFAMVTAEGGSMRYFVNGQNPSTASGVLLEEAILLSFRQFITSRILE
jgi:hypothetical protein